ncbi:MAG: MATE family efflux transporter [Waddliaceae bacterium]
MASKEESSIASYDLGVSSFILLAIPLILFLASDSLMHSVDNFLLARYSLLDWQAYNIIADPFIKFLQVPLIRMATVAQIYVGQAFSAGEQRRIGLFVWQMIWLSLFSTIIVLPLGWKLWSFCLSGNPLEEPAQGFCHLMVAGNVLFPLGAALSSFYIGRGRMTFVICAMVLTFAVNCLLDFLLIFGVGELLPPMGLLGVGLAKLGAQAFFCLVLFCAFLKAKNRQVYGTNHWLFRLKPFLNCLKVSGSTALYVGLISLSWLVVTKMVAWENDNTLTTVVSFGGSCSSLWMFFNLGIGQVLSVRASQVIGSRDWTLMKQLLRSLMCISSCLLFIIALPLLCFPSLFLSFYFGSESFHALSINLKQTLIFTCIAMWCFELIGAFDRTLRSLLSAAGDTTYILAVYIVMIVLFNIIPMYFVLNVWNWPPYTFWYVMNAGILLRNLPLLLRYRQKRWQTTPALVAVQ